MSTCGRCQYGHAIPNHQSKRMCFGEPPTVIPIPAPTPQGFELRAIRAVVEATDPKCHLFQLVIAKQPGVESTPIANGEVGSA